MLESSETAGVGSAPSAIGAGAFALELAVPEGLLGTCSGHLVRQNCRQAILDASKASDPRRPCYSGGCWNLPVSGGWRCRRPLASLPESAGEYRPPQYNLMATIAFLFSSVRIRTKITVISRVPIRGSKRGFEYGIDCKTRREAHDKGPLFG
jgi:hypothetical protein